MPRRRRNPSRYANRTDLATKPTNALPSGRPYGARQALAQQQAAAPLADPLARAIEAARSDPRGAQAGDLARPTERPAEPLTAGAPVGPGPGPEVLPAPGDPVDVLRGVLLANPDNDAVRELIELADQGY